MANAVNCTVIQNPEIYMYKFVQGINRNYEEEQIVNHKTYFYLKKRMRDVRKSIKIHPISHVCRMLKKFFKTYRNHIQVCYINRMHVLTKEMCQYAMEIIT